MLNIGLPGDKWNFAATRLTRPVDGTGSWAGDLLISMPFAFVGCGYAISKRRMDAPSTRTQQACQQEIRAGIGAVRWQPATCAKYRTGSEVARVLSLNNSQ